MQRAPEADGAELLPRRQPFVRKIAHQFIGRHVHIGEDDDLGDRLLDDLRAPARLQAGVKPLAAGEAQLLEDRDHRREMLARGAISVMIVIGPADPQAVLPRLLHAGRRVAALPVFALGGKENIARAIDAQIGDRLINQRTRRGESIRFRVRHRAGVGEAPQNASAQASPAAG